MIGDVLRLVGWLALAALVIPLIGFCYLVAWFFHHNLAAERRFSKRV